MFAIIALLLTTTSFADDPVPAVVPATPLIVAPEVAPVTAPIEVVVPAAPVTAPGEAAPVVAPAPASPLETPEVKVPETTGDALRDGEKAFDAFSAGKWSTAVVLLLGVLAFVYNKFVRKAPAAPPTPPPAV